MQTEELKKLFEGFARTYDQKKSQAIWGKQSSQFGEFWKRRVLEGTGDLTEEEMQPIIRLLDSRAKGIKDSGVEPGCLPGGITQKRWYGLFRELKSDDKLKKLMDKLFNTKSDDEEIKIINEIYECYNNALTHKTANILNDLMFVYNPEHNISVVSLNHRYMIIDAFGLGNIEELKNLSYGEQVTLSRNLIISLKVKLGLDIDNRGLSKAFYYSNPQAAAINKLWFKHREGKERSPRIRRAKRQAHEKDVISPIEDKDILKFLQTLACSPPLPFTVDTLYQLDIAEKIIYNTEFQRGEVWDVPRKQKLIDSILRGYNINTIFFRQLSDGKYECLDGQQRLKTTLKEFLNNKFPVKPKFSPEFNREVFYRQLPEPLKSKIKSYIIYAIIFYTTDDEETCKIFLRLQEGLPLNSAEKLNAMIGYLRNEIVALASHPFMKKLGIRNYRFTHRYILAQLYLIILRNQITDTKFRHLQEIYGTYKNTRSPETVTNAITRILKFLDNQFGDDAQVIRFNADFISLCLLTNHLLEKYATDSLTSDLKEFFIQFAVKVGQVESSEKEEDVPYYDYRTYRKASADSKTSIEKRFNIILSKFLEFRQNIKPKDPNRNFDYWERLAVYWRDKGICQLRLNGCKHKTSFDGGTVDHKIPHSKAGITAINNGQWACINCNLKKGAG